MTTKEFVMMAQLTDQMAARMFAGLSWDKMLELRSEFCRALDTYSKKHKGTMSGVDQVQLDAIGAIARFDRLLRTYFYNMNRNHPRFHNMPVTKAKQIIIKEYDGISRRKF